MLQIENEERLAETAREFWPKSTSAEIGLLIKVFSNIDIDKALEVLEAAKLDSQYQTLPLKSINAKAKQISQMSGGGSYIECWAVHKETGKFKTAWMLASNNEGAVVQMNKYLRVMANTEPEEYTIIVDDINQFHDYRNRIVGLRK